MGQEKTEILPNQITFIEDLEDEKAYEKGNVQVSKSINSYESGEKEAEVPELRFFYKPEKNTIKAEMDWNVHFKVSLNIPAGKQLHNYGEKIQCFQLKHSAERKQGKEKKTWGQWVEAEDFEVEKNVPIKCLSGLSAIMLFRRKIAGGKHMDWRRCLKFFLDVKRKGRKQKPFS